MPVRLTDILEPVTVDKIVAKSENIQGGYITAQTLEDRNKIDIGPLVSGQPVYVTEENKSYRWDAKTSQWLEDISSGGTNASLEALNSHIDDKENPHSVTAKQLGLEGALKNEGDQSIKGSLTLVKETSDGLTNSGNLTVQGNLVVEGTTTTINKEVVEVLESSLILNGTATGLSGIAIKTPGENDSIAYGIMYDPIDDALKFGKGTVEDGGDFRYYEGENSTLLTEGQLSNSTNNGLIAWDNDSGKLINSAIQIDSINQCIDDVASLSSLVEDNSKNIDLLQANAEKIQENSDNISIINDNLGNTDNLSTSARNAVDAINEVHLKVQNLQSDSPINSHIEDKENPHTVTLSQVFEAEGITQNTAFNKNFASHKSQIKMDGDQASVGSLLVVARADHIHPHDSTKADVNHSSSDPKYGVASTNVYGHVKVDEAIDKDSINPVQNKIVKEYVDAEIGKLGLIPIINSKSYSGDVSKTITKFELTKDAETNNVNIVIEDGAIAISDENVSVNYEDIVQIEDDADVENWKDIKTLKESLKKLNNLIKDEAISRNADDNVVLQEAISYTDTEVETLKTNYKLEDLKNFLNTLKFEEWLFTDENESIIRKKIHAETLDVQVKGTWHFNSEIGLNLIELNGDSIEVNVNFESNSEAYKGIKLFRNLENLNILYKMENDEYKTVYQENEWSSPYNIITFTNVQTLEGGNFYKWFANSTTKQ